VLSLAYQGREGARCTYVYEFVARVRVNEYAYQGREGAAEILPCFLILVSHLPWILMVLNCAF